MRIVHVTPFYHPVRGGAEEHIRQFSERLAARGHQVVVLTQRTPGPLRALAPDALPAREIVNSVEVLRLRRNEGLQRLANGILRLPGGYRVAMRLLGRDYLHLLTEDPFSLGMIGAILRQRPAVVAVINWYFAPLAFQACLLRRSGAFRLCGIPLFHTSERWAHSAIYPPMLSRCDAIVANTEHERQFVTERAPRPRIEVLGAGVDPALFANGDGQRLRRDHGIAETPVVGYVGRIAPNKGVVTLVEAMRVVWAADDRVRLVLAGSPYPAGSSLRREIDGALDRLSPAERGRIVVLGQFAEADKAAILGALDVLAMPSVAESFGLAYLEAWMCRKPVIGARIPSTACVIEDGVDGLLVSPTDPRDVAGAILRLLRDPGERARMAARGYRKTMSRFTWDAITQRLESLYLTLTGRGAGRAPSS